MPESPGNIEEIQNSLKASLSRGRSDLDQDVVTASKRVLLEHISFQPASTSYSMQRDVLRTKYIPLNLTPQNGNGWAGGQSQQQQGARGIMTSPVGSEKNNNSLPVPRVVLYPEEKVKMEWTHITRIGAGLVNMGNTCFFNSTLQCLTYTAPLVNYCFTSDHREKCKKKDFCMMCEIQSHIKNSLDCGGRSIKPHSILQKLRCIAKHMKWGRQEDAHEFLRFVVDHLQQACLNGETKLDRFSKETTVINQIFGGYLRSQVTCLRCQAKSDTFDPFMDLSLDIKGVSTVEEALTKFVKPETLEHDNAYKCPKCKNKVRAQKRFSIEKPPNVLTLQLNRFDFHHHLSGKINRFIKYPEKINIRSFMSQKQGEPVLYHLYGVLVHSGHSSEHGHYYSFVKSPSKIWYCMNDSTVHQAGNNSVLSAEAYVLFYARIKSNNSSSSNGPSTPNNNNMNHVKYPQSPLKNPFIGPTLPNQQKLESSVNNGIHGKPTCEIGTPIKQQQPTVPSLQPRIVFGGSKVVSNATSLSGAHNKISFPILTPLQKKQQLLQQKGDGKHIVLQIKHGNSTTMEKSPDGKSKVVNGGVNKPVGLVPYNDDSDSEQENVGRQAAENCIDGKLSQQEMRTSSSLLDAAGDYHNKQSAVQRVVLPIVNKDGDSAAVHKNSGSLLLQSQRDIQTSSSGHHRSSTSDSQNQLKGMQAKHPSAHIPPPPHASSKNFHHTENAPLSSKSIDPAHDLSLISSTTPAPIAGKSGIMELPVVNMSSYAETNSARMKAAGGNWFVQTQDCAPSPRGSCSSSNSVNSSTEWTVESKDSSTHSKPGTITLQEPEKGETGGVTCVQTIVQVANSSSCDRLVSEQARDISSAKPQSPAPAKPAVDHTSTQLSHHPPDRPATPVDISDKQALLHSLDESGVADCGSRKRKKQKKKHKDSERWQYEKLRADSSSHSDSSPKKKKKHKKDRHDKKHKQDSSSSLDNDLFGKRRDKKKRSKHKYSHVHSDSSCSSDEDRRKRRRKSSDDDSDGYEWVEKTVETTKMRDGNTNSRASVQSWNHHVKDDVAPRKEISDKIKSTWDGSRSSATILGLEGTGYSFGNSVLSWDGHKNHNDREVEEETQIMKKRNWSEEYNEEIDAGKTKKVKKHGGEMFLSDNPFQKFQSYKQKPEYHRDSGLSWSQDNSNRQHHDHHYHRTPSTHHWMDKSRSYHPLSKHKDNHFRPYKPHNSSFSH